MVAAPHPQNLEEIKQVIQRDVRQHPDYFQFYPRDEVAMNVQYTLYPQGAGKVLETRLIPQSKTPLFNAYSIIRAMIQSNEACNKLWATMELLHSLSPINCENSLCKSFEVKYTGGTIIPTLYYAQVSALTSLMSTFGSVSIRDRNTDSSFNLVRTKRGWRLYRRKRHIRDLLGVKADSGWHRQILQMLSGLQQMNGFPNLDLDLIESLEKERLKRHYEILGDVSARLSMGLDEYFLHLPNVLSTIGTAIIAITYVFERNPLSGVTRYHEILQNLKRLYLEYDQDFPISDE